MYYFFTDQNIELRQDIASLRLKLEAQVQPAVLAAKQSDEEGMSVVVRKKRFLPTGL